MSTLKSIRLPETVPQAIRFTTVRARYDRAGLCQICSAQAAYAHAHSPSVVEPPCAECAPLVAALPRPVTNAWRLLDLTRTERPEGTPAPPKVVARVESTLLHRSGHSCGHDDDQVAA